jgi:hypothetical protein
MTTGWVAAYTAAGQLQADIVKGLLEAAGIPVWTLREGAGAMYALTVGPMGEVEVMVPAERLAEAEAMIEQMEAGQLETGDLEGQDLNPEDG